MDKIISSESWQLFNRMLSLLPQEQGLKSEDWAVFEKLFESADRLNSRMEEEVYEYIKIWDKKLADFGGDPAGYDWKNFRPLRLSREEDWSDWLAHLISSSRSGYFAFNLFRFAKFAIEDYISPQWVNREPSVDDCRSDILIQWKNGAYTNIEIKIGDPGLEKTFYTSKKLSQKHRTTNADWIDVIILMSGQLSEWERIRQKYSETIYPVTWEDVALSLRKSLLYQKELFSWRAWAYAFLGAVEQTILGFPRHNEKKLLFRTLSGLNSRLNILKEGLSHEG